MVKRVDGTSSSLHQPKEGGRKRKSGINADIYDQVLEELETELRRLKDGYEELVKEKEQLESKRTASKLEIKTLKSQITASEQNIETLDFGVTALEQKSEKLKDEETELEQKIDEHKSRITYVEQKLVGLRSSMENMSMDIDSPKGSPGDPMEIDLSEGEMTELVKETSSPDGTEELNLQQPELCINKNQEQPESSKSKRVPTFEQGRSGAKVEASPYQPNKRGQKHTLTPAERKARKNACDRKRRNDQKIELGELRAKIPLFEDLKNKTAQLVRENKKLKSEIADMIQQMETLKNCKENKLMGTDIPLDLGFLNGKDFVSMIDDLSDAKLLDEIDALFPLPPPKEGLATNKLITQGTGNSQTEVLESDKEQIQADLAKIDNKIPSACRTEELATNKDATAGKYTTEGALKLKRMGEDELNEELNGKLAMAVNDTSTCSPTSSALSSGFTSNTCQSIRQFATALVTGNHLLSTGGGAESREATRDKRASTSASGEKGTTDVLKLEKNLEACVSPAI